MAFLVDFSLREKVGWRLPCVASAGLGWRNESGDAHAADQHTVEVDQPKAGARAALSSPVRSILPIRRVQGGPPYAAFARLRAEARWPERGAGERPGFWSVTRYEDVMRVNGDTRPFPRSVAAY